MDPVLVNQTIIRPSTLADAAEAPGMAKGPALREGRYPVHGPLSGENTVARSNPLKEQFGSQYFANRSISSEIGAGIQGKSFQTISRTPRVPQLPPQLQKNLLPMNQSQGSSKDPLGRIDRTKRKLPHLVMKSEDDNQFEFRVTSLNQQSLRTNLTTMNKTLQVSPKMKQSPRQNFNQKYKLNPRAIKGLQDNVSSHYRTMHRPSPPPHEQKLSPIASNTIDPLNVTGGDAYLSPQGYKEGGGGGLFLFREAKTNPNHTFAQGFGSIFKIESKAKMRYGKRPDIATPLPESEHQPIEQKRAISYVAQSDNHSRRGNLPIPHQPAKGSNLHNVLINHIRNARMAAQLTQDSRSTPADIRLEPSPDQGAANPDGATDIISPSGRINFKQVLFHAIRNLKSRDSASSGEDTPKQLQAVGSMSNGNTASNFNSKNEEMFNETKDIFIDHLPLKTSKPDRERQVDSKTEVTVQPRPNSAYSSGIGSQRGEVKATPVSINRGGKGKKEGFQSKNDKAKSFIDISTKNKKLAEPVEQPVPMSVSTTSRAVAPNQSSPQWKQNSSKINIHDESASQSKSFAKGVVHQNSSREVLFMQLEQLKRLNIEAQKSVKSKKVLGRSSIRQSQVSSPFFPNEDRGGASKANITPTELAARTPGEVGSSQRISKIMTTPGEQKIIKASLGSVISSGKKEYSHWITSQEIKKSETHDPINTRARDSHEVLSPVSIYKGGGKNLDKSSLNISMDVNPIGDPSPIKTKGKPESSKRDRVVTQVTPTHSAHIHTTGGDTLSTKPDNNSTDVRNRQPTSKLKDVEYQCIPIKVWDCHQILNEKADSSKASNVKKSFKHSHNRIAAGLKQTSTDGKSEVSILTDGKDGTKDIANLNKSLKRSTIGGKKYSFINHQMEDLKVATPAMNRTMGQKFNYKKPLLEDDKTDSSEIGALQPDATPLLKLKDRTSTEKPPPRKGSPQITQFRVPVEEGDQYKQQRRSLLNSSVATQKVNIRQDSEERHQFSKFGFITTSPPPEKEEALLVHNQPQTIVTIKKTKEEGKSAQKSLSPSRFMINPSIINIDSTKLEGALQNEPVVNSNRNSLKDYNHSNLSIKSKGKKKKKEKSPETAFLHQQSQIFFQPLSNDPSDPTLFSPVNQLQITAKRMSPINQMALNPSDQTFKNPALKFKPHIMNQQGKNPLHNKIKVVGTKAKKLQPNDLALKPALQISPTSTDKKKALRNLQTANNSEYRNSEENGQCASGLDGATPQTLDLREVQMSININEVTRTIDSSHPKEPATATRKVVARNPPKPQGLADSPQRSTPNKNLTSDQSQTFLAAASPGQHLPPTHIQSQPKIVVKETNLSASKDKPVIAQQFELMARRNVPKVDIQIPADLTSSSHSLTPHKTEMKKTPLPLKIKQSQKRETVSSSVHRSTRVETRTLNKQQMVQLNKDLIDNRVFPTPKQKPGPFKRKTAKPSAAQQQQTKDLIILLTEAQQNALRPSHEGTPGRTILDDRSEDASTNNGHAVAEEHPHTLFNQSPLNSTSTKLSLPQLEGITLTKPIKVMNSPRTYRRDKPRRKEKKEKLERKWSISDICNAYAKPTNKKQIRGPRMLIGQRGRGTDKYSLKQLLV